MGYQTLADGTRVYDKGYRYTPRTSRVYRKAPKGTQWFGGKAFGPLPLLPDAERVMPATRSDAEAATHKLGCRCASCKLPRVQLLKRERIYAELRRASR
jgi:hypothetical protein